MSGRALVIQGEVHLTLDAVADCFEVEVAWVEEVHALGLLGAGRRVEGATAVAAVLLDRVAEVLRLYRYGIALEVVAVLLSPLDLELHVPLDAPPA